MAGERVILVFLVAFLSIIARADNCGAGPVSSLTLNSNGTLSWVAPTVANKSCSLTYYLVYIENDDYHLIYNTQKSASLSVSFLPVCVDFKFTVIPVFGNEEGTSQQIVAKTPPKINELYEVQFLNITQDNNDIYVEWATKDKVENCISHYRFTYQNDYNDTPTDVQVKENYYILQDLIPCLNYKIEVRVILDNLTEGPANLTNITSAAFKPSTPSLLNVGQYPTSLETAWKVQNIDKNRCPLLQLILDASPSFNLTVPINKTIEQLNVTITNLTPNTAYVTKAYLVNTAGTSPSLNTILQTASNTSWWFWK